MDPLERERTYAIEKQQTRFNQSEPSFFLYICSSIGFKCCLAFGFNSSNGREYEKKYQFMYCYMRSLTVSQDTMSGVILESKNVFFDRQCRPRM